MSDLKIRHTHSDEDGHELEFYIKGRLGAMPTLIESLLKSTIKPLAEKYDPHWQPTELPVTPPDDEGSRLPKMNQDDPNRPGVGDQF